MCRSGRRTPRWMVSHFFLWNPAPPDPSFTSVFSKIIICTQFKFYLIHPKYILLCFADQYFVWPVYQIKSRNTRKHFDYSIKRIIVLLLYLFFFFFTANVSPHTHLSPTQDLLHPSCWETLHQSSRIVIRNFFDRVALWKTAYLALNLQL